MSVAQLILNVEIVRNQNVKTHDIGTLFLQLFKDEDCPDSYTEAATSKILSLPKYKKLNVQNSGLAGASTEPFDQVVLAMDCCRQLILCSTIHFVAILTVFLSSQLLFIAMFSMVNIFHHVL